MGEEAESEVGSADGAALILPAHASSTAAGLVRHLTEEAAEVEKGQRRATETVRGGSHRPANAE